MIRNNTVIAAAFVAMALGGGCSSECNTARTQEAPERARLTRAPFGERSPQDDVPMLHTPEPTHSHGRRHAPKATKSGGTVVVIDRDGRKRSAYLFGTEEYARKEASLRISFDEARLAAVEYYERQYGVHLSGGIGPGVSWLIVGDDYLFAPADKFGFSLDGITVDGNTGRAGQSSLGAQVLRYDDHPRWAEIYASVVEDIRREARRDE